MHHCFATFEKSSKNKQLDFEYENENRNKKKHSKQLRKLKKERTRRYFDGGCDE